MELPWPPLLPRTRPALPTSSKNVKFDSELGLHMPALHLSKNRNHRIFTGLLHHAGKYRGYAAMHFGYDVG